MPLQKDQGNSSATTKIMEIIHHSNEAILILNHSRRIRTDKNTKRQKLQKSNNSNSVPN